MTFFSKIYSSLLSVINKRADPSSGAVIMGIGIFLVGGIYQFPTIQSTISEFLLICLFMLWFIFSISFFRITFRRAFKKYYLYHPIKSFALGTWIAASSITGLLILRYYPNFHFGLKILGVINGLLWLCYITICLFCFREIIKHKLYDKVHGIILLTTVTTQAIVILYSQVYGSYIPELIYKIIIVIGLLFYIFSFILIFYRYCFLEREDFAEQWQNTNCILHGAASITGVAAILSGVIPEIVILFLWIWAVVWFIIVETIEVIRASRRLKKYNFREALCTYHVSQWARNFTFGTFYVFNEKLRLLDSVHFLSMGLFNNIILKFLGTALISLLLVQLFVYFSQLNFRFLVFKNFNSGMQTKG